jgi:hypothetical protein
MYYPTSTHALFSTFLGARAESTLLDVSLQQNSKILRYCPSRMIHRSDESKGQSPKPSKEPLCVVKNENAESPPALEIEESKSGEDSRADTK